MVTKCHLCSRAKNVRCKTHMGSENLPKNKTAFDIDSTIANKNGWSAINGGINLLGPSIRFSNIKP